METYAAPLLNIDYIVNETQKIFDSFVQDYNFVDIVEKLELQLKNQKEEDSDINILKPGDSIQEDIERKIDEFLLKRQSAIFEDDEEQIEERNDKVEVEETEDENEKIEDNENVEVAEKEDDDEMVDIEEEVIENKGEQAKKED